MMMNGVTWAQFPWFAWPSLALAAAASVAAMQKHRSRWALSLAGASLVVYAAFIMAFWAGLHRPPLRTVGETRLWYAFFVMLAGLLTYVRWKYRYMLSATTVMAAVFVGMNLLRPEIHDQWLMPALQSGWFVPHVTVYMLAYAMLGCAFLLAVAGLWKGAHPYLDSIDALVAIGTAFLTMGMLSGALWAKEAWGNYWSWDPKETWAAATWCFYLIYIHLRLSGWRKADGRDPMVLLLVAFLCLQMSWYGVNYLPSARESLHTYSTSP